MLMSLESKRYHNIKYELHATSTTIIRRNIMFFYVMYGNEEKKTFFIQYLFTSHLNVYNEFIYWKLHLCFVYDISIWF